MLGDIDYYKKPVTPQLFLCKPDRTIISKLSEAYQISKATKLAGVYELTFSLPYFIDQHHRLLPNRHIDIVRERYLIKVVEGSQTEWFFIHTLDDEVQEDANTKAVSCYSINQQLADKMIKEYSEESKQAEEILQFLLTDTLWSVDYIDADFKLTYRAFDFPNSTVLECLGEVAETYNAILEFNSERRTVSLRKPELTGINKGLTFSWSKYLKSMNRSIQTDEMVTRLKAFGQDDLGIQDVNPTGQNYIENFGYWIYPFERDTQRQVLQSSHYMSDSLCHALLDYAALLESKKELFQIYLKERQGYEHKLNELSVQLDALLKNESVITDTMLSQQFDGKMFFEKYQHSGSSSRSFNLNNGFPYAAMIKVEDVTGMTVSLNGANQGIQAGKWVLLGKVRNQDTLQITVSGGSSSVYMQVCTISVTEYEENNKTAIIERYSLDNKEMQITQKKLEMGAEEQKITEVSGRITQLQSQTSKEVNFTEAQLIELGEYIIEREYVNSSIIDAEDLLKEAEAKFKELQTPQLSIELDVVNFLEIVEEQYNWDKLVLGDFVNIKYEPLGIQVTARITEINYDYEGSSISIVVSNAKDVNDETKRLEKFLSEVKNTSVTVDSNKFKWGKAVYDTSEMSQLFENFWNKVTNEVNMASNEFVDISQKGITITDPNDPQRFLRATHGVLALTRSGGLRYETAISADGVIAEQVLGKIILGQRVVIGDPDGLWMTEGPTTTITDRCGREVVKLGLTSTQPDRFGVIFNNYASTDCDDKSIVNHVGMDSATGFYIDQRNGSSFEKRLWTDVQGTLHAQNIRVKDSIIADGSMTIGTGSSVFKVDANGLRLGNESMSSAPFRVTPDGVMYAKGGKFQDGQLIVGSGSRVVLIDSKGISVGGEDIDTAPAAIYINGKARFRNLELTTPDGKFLADTANRRFDLLGWDLVGVGAIDASLISANMITAQDGIISTIRAGSLSTLTNAAATEWSNYIRIQANEAKWITGQVEGQGTQRVLEDGRKLYWKDASQFGEMTVEVTEWPVMEYSMQEKIKAKFTFTGVGDQAYPVVFMGEGDLAGNGVGTLEKPADSFNFVYKARNSGRERSVRLDDLGLRLYVDGNDISQTARNITLSAQQGYVKLMNNNASITLKPDGSIEFTGTRYDFT